VQERIVIEVTPQDIARARRGLLGEDPLSIAARRCLGSEAIAWDGWGTAQAELVVEGGDGGEVVTYPLRGRALRLYREWQRGRQPAPARLVLTAPVQGEHP
jgi:hypothetical protein